MTGKARKRHRLPDIVVHCSATGRYDRLRTPGRTAPGPVTLAAEGYRPAGDYLPLPGLDATCSQTWHRKRRGTDV